MSTLGVPYVGDTAFLDIQKALNALQTTVPDLVSIVSQRDEVTGQVHQILESVCGLPIGFDLAFCNKLTYREGDAKVGWLDDLQPLFSVYQGMLQKGLIAL